MAVVILGEVVKWSADQFYLRYQMGLLRGCGFFLTKHLADVDHQFQSDSIFQARAANWTKQLTD